MSLPSISLRCADDLRYAMELRMQRIGMTSMAAYIKFLVRKDCLSGYGDDIATLAQRIPEARLDDLDSAILRICEAPESKRSKLIVILGEAMKAICNPKTRRDLQSVIWHGVSQEDAA